MRMGPGLGVAPQVISLTRSLFAESDKSMVLDADGLNALAEHLPDAPAGKLRVLTPHPGEMSRLTRQPVDVIQADRVGPARKLATDRQIILVLKGARTVIALPERR